MPLIHSLRNHIARRYRPMKLRTINHRRSIFDSAGARHSSTDRGSIANRHRADCGMRGRGYSIDRNAAVHNHPVVYAVIVDHRRVVINSRNFAGPQMPMTEIAMSEISVSHECEMIRSQSKIKIETHSQPVKPPSESNVEHSMRRDGRPSAIISGTAPNHPCRSPHCVRCPNPTTTMM